MFYDKRPIFDSEIQIKAMAFVEIQQMFDMSNSSQFKKKNWLILQTTSKIFYQLSPCTLHACCILSSL